MTQPSEAQRIELTFAPGAGEQLAAAVIGIIERYAELRVPIEPEAAGPDVEPWTFYAPREKCEVTAFLDDRQQVRHVPTARAAEVPAGWRRIYLATSG